MDFTNRNRHHANQTDGPLRPAEAAATPAVTAPSASPNSPNEGSSWTKWRIWGTGIVIIAIALMVAAILWLSFSTKPANQAKYVDTDNLQAVFLNNNQVYFGDITGINGDYLVLSNIYYLQSPQQVSNKSTDQGNVSLVKLGCELHRPQDQMVINQDQVSFWENLQDDGQVAKAVKQFEQANPNGQQCKDQPAQQQQPQSNQDKAADTSNNGTKATDDSKQE